MTNKEQILEFEKKFTMEVKLPGKKRIRSISGISADWKEVKSWLSKALDTTQQATIEEIEKIKPINDPSEEYERGQDYMYREINRVLDKLKKG